MQERFHPAAHTTRDNSAHQHRPSPLAAAGAIVGGAAAGEGPDRRLLPGERAQVAAGHRPGGGGADAVEAHDLVTVGEAAGVGVGGAGTDGVAVLLEAGGGGGRVLDLEHHLDPRRRRRGGGAGPAGVEDDLDDVAGGVAGGELSQGGEEGGRGGPGWGGRGRAGHAGAAPRRRGEVVRALLVVVVGEGDVGDGAGGLAAAGGGEEGDGLGVVDVVRSSGLAL